MSIHAQPTKQVYISRDGQRCEFTTQVDPNRHLPVHLALQGWLQEVTLDDVTNLWYMAQRRRKDNEQRLARLEQARGRTG